MTDRRIEREALPPLPDDIDEAAQARVSAQRRVSEARENGTRVFSFVDEVRDMRLHNNWGPGLELAFGLRGLS